MSSSTSISRLLHPDYARAFQEFSSGSKDSILLGIKVIGSSFKEILPQVYQLPSEGENAFVLQKKARHLLGSLANDESLDIANDPRLKNRLQTIGFLTKAALNYGLARTRYVYSNLDPSEREKIDMGETTILPSQKQTMRELFESEQDYVFPLPKQMELPSLPGEEERCNYWRQVELITRSKEGHIGVFYTYSPGCEDLVVKAPNRAAQECFASRIFQALGFMTPDTVVVDRYSDEGKLIEAALSPFEEFQKHCREVSFQKFFVMNRVHGRAFEEIDEVVAKSAFTNDEICFYSILEQIGRIAAVDVFMYYQDRFSHIGYSNLGNLMCLEQQGGRITTAVAIDQSVDLSKPYSGFVVGKKKIETIQEVVADVLGSGNKISQAANALWDDIPKHLQQYAEKSEAVYHLHRGLIAGFQAISEKITPETLYKIDRELQPNYTDRDFICVKDLMRVLEMIKQAVLDSGSVSC